jgi:hypothetical protein
VFFRIGEKSRAIIRHVYRLTKFPKKSAVEDDATSTVAQSEYNGSFRQGALFWLITWRLFASLTGKNSVILKVRPANTLLANVC